MKPAHAFFLASFSIVACRHASETEPELQVTVRCVSPTRESIDETLKLRGHVELPPGGDLPLASQVGGRIIELSVHEGQTVHAGDIVATVDDLASRDAVRQAEAALATARATSFSANAALERTRALVARGIAASQELDEATARAETEKQSVASGVAALDVARHTLGRVQVRASFGGLITKVWRGAGALVDGTAATPIAQVAAASGVEMVADATERDLARIAPGRPAKIQLGPDTPLLDGSVRAVSTALDSTTGLGQIRISLDPSAKVALIGSRGTVTIDVRHRDGVLLVPIESLRGAVADGAELVVCEKGNAQLRAVQVGFRDEHRLEILSGLSMEERVAVDHVLGLETGTALKEAK